MNWTRPLSIKYPQVWHKFEKVSKDGKIIKFKVQDLTKDYHDDLFEMIKNYYVKEEAWVANTKIGEEASSLKVLIEFYKNHVLSQNISVVCTLDDDTENRKVIVGFNLLRVTLKSKGEDFSEFSKSKNTEKYLTMYKMFVQLCPNIFEKFDTDTYLGSNALFVSKDFRNMSIGAEILKARIPICKALGIKISTSKFTMPASQNCAKKAGFKEIAAVSYELFREELGLEFKNCIDCKLMTLVIE